MNTGDINLTRDAIVAAIAKALPELKDCQAHGGRFDLQELKRWSRRAPAVLVAAVQIPEAARNRVNQVTVRWVAYVVASDAPGVSRDVIALDYTEALLRCIKDNRWGLDNTQRPENVAAENLYSGPADRQGIALWAVSWQQALTLRATDISDLADFAIYSATHQVGDGPDTESYTEIPTGNEET
ncbi:phage protein Gp37 [Marinobacter subterrani]|uniref:Mu-like prophage protein gp37 n=1 Tax=Marinobacter subterrani TaxID=1658765 RepID=A0A0J7J7S1_9GAMM|nr:phage protein Gp37 [Marinobacter subterrani]KMQ74004.1 Mu-like prophage protein gp37 [Marinobacter subterrani]